MNQKLLTASPSLRHRRIRQFIYGGQAIQASALLIQGLLYLIDHFTIELPIWLSTPLEVSSFGILIPGFTAFWWLQRFSFVLAICGFIVANTFFYGLLGFIIANATYPRSNLYCLNCEYNLTGNVSGVCPECGTEIK